MPERTSTESETESEACESEIRFSYDSLHDFVGPANRICTLTGLLIRQYGERLGPDANGLVDLIEDSKSRLQILGEGLRRYAQIVDTPSTLELRDANALFVTSLAPIKSMILDSGASVSQDRLPELLCDGAQIGYVFTSLVENAIKFRSSAPPRIHVAAISSGDNWTFAVRDNGIGIDPKHHRRIFKMFKRVHNDGYPGAGVGLTITEAILRRRGGRIWVESELGSGATFFFTLPCARPTGGERA